MKHIRIFAVCLAFLVTLPAQEPTDPCQALKQRIQSTESRLQDWPNLGRYADANANLGLPAKGEPRVVFLGDSITDQWKLAEYFPGKAYVNRGISGQTTPQMLVRFRPDVLELHPKMVVVLAGTNDLAGNTGPMTLQMTENNLLSIAELAQANSVQVVLASVLPVSDYGPRKQTERRPPAKIRELNSWIKQYCKEHNLVYLDYYSHLLDDKGMLPSNLSEDGLHPNAAGYKVMAPLAEEAIQQTLKNIDRTTATTKPYRGPARIYADSHDLQNFESRKAKSRPHRRGRKRRAENAARQAATQTKPLKHGGTEEAEETKPITTHSLRSRMTLSFFAHVVSSHHSRGRLYYYP